ncbi:MAG: prolipoprotein diacylglyceryl transferase [Bacilli bacterium]|nr:prolipoprotein diacylglyceryl transferase [Bacilli bacterium]
MVNSFKIFNFTIHFYSLCILLGIIVAYIIIRLEAHDQRLDKDYIFNTVFYGLVIGILGARIHYVLFNLDYYLTYPLEIIKIWHGGLAIHGGIIAAAIFVYFYSTKRYKTSFLRTTDVILPGVLVAQGIGRWGNFFNQEAYGIEVSEKLLHKLLIPNFVIKGMFIDGAYHLPTFYIESILCIIGFLIIILIRTRLNNRVGYVTAFYLIWYGIIRFIIELFRTDSLMLFNIKIACIISVIFILLGIVLFIYSTFKRNIRYRRTMV